MKKSLIIVNTNKIESKELSIEISQYLQSKSISSEFVNFDGFTANKEIKDFDFIITLGGDGTVLYAARNCVQSKIPIFPINLGEFGFIASVSPDDWKSPLDDFLCGKAPIQERCMIKVVHSRGNVDKNTFLALNDVVISSNMACRTIRLDISYDSNHLCKLKSDGVIFATPTGSTAYSASAGGPILAPDLKAFVMTPLNSFSLSSRPIVLNTDGIIDIEIEKSRTKEVALVVDGQSPIELTFDDHIKISMIEEKVKLVFCSTKKFYSALRSKLNWSGGPHA